MENSFNNEKAPVDKQEVINRLKDYGLEDETTKSLLGQYAEYLNASTEGLTDHTEQQKARIENSITLALMYKEAGYLGEAWDELNETIDAAVSINDRDLADQINKHLDDLESGN